MKFFKYHGCGNDFIIIKKSSINNINYSELASKMCNRYTGIGADGLIVVEENPLKMHFYNQDGSLGTMCGNGIRCLAHFCYQNCLTNNLQYVVQTLDGEKIINIIQTNPFIVQVDMGRPQFTNEIMQIDSPIEPFLMQKITYRHRTYDVNAIHLGTKHLIIWVNNLEEDVTEGLGSYLCNYHLFKDRINVDFVEVVNIQNFKIITYERGVGFTKACGTGACAAYVIGKMQNKCSSFVNVMLEYGNLSITSTDTGHIMMQGPSEFIAHGIYNIEK